MVSTLDPFAKSTNITLSGGNLTFVNSPASTSGIVRGTPIFYTGKWYWEATMTTVGSSGNAMIGVINRSLSFGTILGGDANSLAMQGSGAVRYNGGTLTTIQTYTSGSVVCVALDMDNGLIWFRTGAGNWNNSGTANPATGVGGISIAGVKAQGVLSPVLMGVSNNDAATINFGNSFSQTPPAGFSAANLWSFAPTAYRNGAVESMAVSYTQYNAALSGTPGAPSQKSAYPGTDAVACTNAFYGGYKVWSPAGPITVASGQVQENGSPVAGKNVFLFDHATGLLLGATVSDGSGNFSIPALGHTKIFAVATDDPTYNALIFDGLVPI